ncbi:MAG: glycosyltransferase family 2 protein [Bacilli bacterium]|nr:glycosyltransferase family 2 protein [Bacilli bacterium]
MKKISFIIPCYNEEDNVIKFYNKVNDIFKDRIKDIELIFVDDGSKDNTLENIKKLYKEFKNINYISFSRNFGKEAAILAGLKESKGEYTVIIDADLQQNPKYVLEMEKILDENKEYDVVCCVQEKRKENIFKKVFKKAFYKIYKSMLKMDVMDSASDFRLMRRNVLEAIISLPETIRFSKGLFTWVGFNTYYISYKVEDRYSGKSKWSISKLFKYAFDGIVGFSDAPLFWTLKLGLFFVVIAVLGLIAILVLFIIGIKMPTISLIIICALFLLSGSTLISNGILGKYLSNAYNESKNRPSYIIKESKTNDKKD